MELSMRKDKHQRAECGCAESVDIGAYNTCRHQCLYCYAYSFRNATCERSYDPHAPLLCDNILPEDHVTERKMPRMHLLQKDLF